MPGPGDGGAHRLDFDRRRPAAERLEPERLEGVPLGGRESAEGVGRDQEAPIQVARGLLHFTPKVTRKGACWRGRPQRVRKRKTSMAAMTAVIVAPSIAPTRLPMSAAPRKARPMKLP